MGDAFHVGRLGEGEGSQYLSVLCRAELFEELDGADSERYG